MLKIVKFGGSSLADAEHFKKVYKIDYKPSEWVEQQRQLMIDSALYLDSEEFKETFPQINKLIRTRKTDIQKMVVLGYHHSRRNCNRFFRRRRGGYAVIGYYR